MKRLFYGFLLSVLLVLLSACKADGSTKATDSGTTVMDGRNDETMAEGIVTNVLSTLEKLHDMDVVVWVPALVY